MGKILFGARKIDNLGRITVPKGLRKFLDIKQGDLLGVFVSADTKQIVLKKLETEEK